MSRQGKVVEEFSALEATEEKIMYAAIHLMHRTLPRAEDDKSVRDVVTIADIEALERSLTTSSFRRER